MTLLQMARPERHAPFRQPGARPPADGHGGNKHGFKEHGATRHETTKHGTTGRRSGRRWPVIRGSAFHGRLPGVLLRCTAGVSAVEFAIVAPLLVLGAFATADVGLAIYQRMMIGQSLRASAQVAMAGADEDAVRAVLQDVASQNFTVAGEGEPAGSNALTVGISSYCGCPADGFAEVPCGDPCPSGAMGSKFYRLAANKTFDGVMLPAFPISGAIEVMAE